MSDLVERLLSDVQTEDCDCELCELFREAADEIKRLRTELSDIEESYRRTVESPCSPVEVHCSCVPALRQEIERLREKCNEVRLVGQENAPEKVGTLEKIGQLIDSLKEGGG